MNQTEKLVEALEKIEDILVEVSANLINKSKEQELVHKAFLISKKAVKESQALESYKPKGFVYFIEDTNPSRTGLWFGVEPVQLNSWSTGFEVWTNDPSKALKFNTLQEAEEQIKKLHIEGLIVTEHEFVPKAALESYKDGWISVEEVISFMKQEELLIDIHKFFREDGSHITKKEYGILVINEMIESLKNKFLPTPPQADSHDRTNP